MKKLILTCAVLGGFLAVGARAEGGDAVFAAKCAICHGKDGKGQTKMGEKLGIKDLTDAAVQAKLTDEQLMQTLKEGIKDGEKTKMKGYGSVLSADELKALATFVRSLAKKG